jgi:hypothetical protein
MQAGAIKERQLGEVEDHVVAGPVDSVEVAGQPGTGGAVEIAGDGDQSYTGQVLMSQHQRWA